MNESVEPSVAAEEAPPIPNDAPAPVPPSKISKIDQKRQKIFQDRMARFMSKGMNPQQALDALQREDYERLPVTDKIKKLEGAMFGNFRQIGNDIGILRQNQDNLADVLDVNFRAFEKMLVKLGVSVEDQKELFKAAEAEVRAEFEARAAAQKAQEQTVAPESAPQG